MKTFLLTVAAFLSIATTRAQTIDEIISKHVNALGGQDKLSQVNSVYLESVTDVMGNTSKSKTTVLNGKGYKSETDFNGQKIVQAIDDKGGWAINPMSGSNDATPFPQEQYKVVEDQMYITPLLNYTAHGAKAELLGQEKVGLVNAYKIKYTNKDNGETTYYIDPATWYVIQAVKKGNAMGRDITITVSLSDYRKTDFGIYVPYSSNVDMGQFALKTNITKVEVNNAVDPSIFQMPK